MIVHEITGDYFPYFAPFAQNFVLSGNSWIIRSVWRSYFVSTKLTRVIAYDTWLHVEKNEMLDIFEASVICDEGNASYQIKKYIKDNGELAKSVGEKGILKIPQQTNNFIIDKPDKILSHVYDDPNLIICNRLTKKIVPIKIEKNFNLIVHYPSADESTILLVGKTKLIILDNPAQ